MAAVSIHYINDTMSDLAELITAGDSSLIYMNVGNSYLAHWAEMRAYAHGLIYNDFKLIDESDISAVFGYMGNGPVFNDGADFSGMQTLHDRNAVPPPR